MNCREAQQWRHALVDGELELAKTAEVENHIADCPNCDKAIEDLKTLRALVRSSEPAFKAPTGLWDRVRPTAASTPESTVVARPRFTRPWLQWAFPAAIATLLVALAFVTISTRSANRQTVRELASSHIRSLQAGHLMDVVSTDQHTVKPWFDGKLDFAPTVNNLAAENFPLVGGRLDYIGERTVAALIYSRAKHTINLFIWPAADGSSALDNAVVERGYNLVHWTDSGMEFWAVSDLNRVELQEFARLFRAAPAASAPR